MFEIVTCVITEFQQNCRIIFDPETKDAVIVDPGGDAQLLLTEIKERDLNLAEIWLTHSHLDHVGGVKALKKATGATILGHECEQELRQRVEEICEMYGLPLGDMENCPEPDQYIDGGAVLSIGGCEFTALFTPGHSPGHLCFYHKESDTLIAGDTLFAGSIGRTDLPLGDHAQLIESIKTEILTLPDETKVLPGHGPDTTVGVERKSNPFLTGQIYG